MPGPEIRPTGGDHAGAVVVNANVWQGFASGVDGVFSHRPPALPPTQPPRVCARSPLHAREHAAARDWAWQAMPYLRAGAHAPVARSPEDAPGRRRARCRGSRPVTLAVRARKGGASCPDAESTAASTAPSSTTRTSKPSPQARHVFLTLRLSKQVGPAAIFVCYREVARPADRAAGAPDPAVSGGARTGRLDPDGGAHRLDH